MKIFNWMHSKIQAKPPSSSATYKPNDPFSSIVTLNQQEYSRAEFSDWWPASGLLVIGTFGINENLQKPVRDVDDDDHHPTDSQTHAPISHDISSLNPEEVLKMSEELCSMIEDDDRVVVVGSGDENRGSVERSMSSVLSRGKSKDDCTNNGLKKEIGHRSLSFLFKKIYRRGFSASPRLGDPMPESRIDKILRAILHKKIYPQSSSATAVKKKQWLENKPPAASDSKYDDYMDDTTATSVSKKDGKWIKTDSDFIVLEI
uniref:Uncharacterized protein n=1 Tax=Kalanchoe fedtschenkoi TaxID=63787 RepID=A0A7N0UPL7_KALFE